MLIGLGVFIGALILLVIVGMVYGVVVQGKHATSHGGSTTVTYQGIKIILAKLLH